MSRNKEENIRPIEVINSKDNYIWISGEAGSGKTTLLQWIATTIASNDSRVNTFKTVIPILIELRKYDIDSISIKKVIEQIMRESTYQIPEGWIENALENGRLLLLLDGFDEIKKEEREKVFDWIKEFDYDNICKKIFTSRPQVKERPSMNTVEYIIQPMDIKKIKQYILYWHRAVLEDSLEIDKDKSESISLDLFDKVRFSDSLKRIVTNPLLCALICALHYQNNMNLPSDKRQIYEECCKMLFENRDRERNIGTSSLDISYEQKRTILATLAYWMMRNNYVEISRQQAINVISNSISGMNIDRTISKEAVLDYLIQRCGVLREPECDRIDFIHRTFQEYLTANEIARSGDWGYLKTKIYDEEWLETIELAIGYANENEANEILKRILDDYIECNDRKKLIVAIKILSGAIEVDSTIRDNIEKQLYSVVPPKTFSECCDIALAGDLAIPFLQFDFKHNDSERYMCLKTLRMIATKKSLSMAKKYLSNNPTDDEIREFGILISKFEYRVLKELEIPEVLLHYVNNRNTEVLTVHDAFLRIIYLSGLRLQNNNYKSVHVIDYSEQDEEDRYGRLLSNIDFQSSFPLVEKVMIDGSFSKLNILNSFYDIKELDIICSNPSFSIYNLFGYISDLKIKKIKLLLTSRDYISGGDLPFLEYCEDLTLFMLNKESEIDLSNFYCSNSLKKLEIGSCYTNEIIIDKQAKIEFIKVFIDDDNVFSYSDYGMVPRYCYDYFFNSKDCSDGKLIFSK